MSLRTTLIPTIIAALLAAAAAQAQSIVPVSMSLQAEAFARLDWTNPLTPDSIDTDFNSGTGLGEVVATAHPSNQGITSVDAIGEGGSLIATNGNGYRLVVAGSLRGHSNLAAIADASFAAITTLIFDLTQPADISLDFLFTSNYAGFGQGELSTSLTGPGGTSIFSFTSPASTPGALEFSEFFTLPAGQYTLSYMGSGSTILPPGEVNANLSTGGFATIHIVPAPGSLALLALVGLVGRSRRRE